MFDQLFETFRKASESWLQAQQELFKQWVQQWPTAPLTAAGVPKDWSDIHHRWLESTTQTLSKHREMIDSTYKTGIDVIAQAFRVTEAKSPEDYRRLVEELWRKLSDTFKAQTEAQFRDLQAVTEKWLDRTSMGSNATNGGKAAS